MDLTKQIERLKDIENCDPTKPLVAGVFLVLGGTLIYAYTGWSVVPIWACYVFAATCLHNTYIQARLTHPSRAEKIIASILFANVQISFPTLPTYMFIQDTPVLAVAGGALIGAQMVFQLRRNTTLPIYSNVQCALMLLISIVIFLALSPYYDKPLAAILVALSLACANFFFWQGVQSGRKIWLRNRAALEASQHAQKMAAIGQLAGGVAHDFNNNLTAIIGSLELIQATDDPAEHEIDVNNALIAARQAASTVKQLLIYARMQRQDIAAVQVQEIIDELEKLTLRLIPVNVELAMPAPNPAQVVWADRSQLLAALINLVVNAVDSMPDGGRLALRAQEIAVQSPIRLVDSAQLGPGDFVRISVTDTGHGIPPELLSKIFDPFFTTKPVGKGTGLGLSMVLGMSRELGGGLTISSGAQGTRINLYLPSADLSEISPDAA